MLETISETLHFLTYILDLCVTGAITFTIKRRDEEESQEDTDLEKDISSQETPSDPSTIIFEEYSGKLIRVSFLLHSGNSDHHVPLN